MAGHAPARRSIRLTTFDYARAAAYFVTVCAWRRTALFGEVADGQVQLNEAGTIVHDEWLRTASVRPYVELDAFVVMPTEF